MYHIRCTILRLAFALCGARIFFFTTAPPEGICGLEFIAVERGRICVLVVAVVA